MHRGYIKIWRKTLDSGLLQKPNSLALFVYMLMEATHKPIRYGTVELERGQLVTGRHKLSKELNMSEQTVRTCIEHLTKFDFITSKSTNKFTVYTIVNYSKYQDTDVVPNQEDNQQATNEQPTTNQQLTTIQEHKHIRSKSISSSKGTRLPQDAILTATWGNLALEIRPDWANDDVRIEYEAFKDYWIAKAGKDGVKLDWLATWRNWCRNSRRKGSLNAG